jgi:S1-C subfamily serine protease
MAQTQAWVQIEAQPSQGAAEARARDYAGTLPDVEGHALASGWYAVVLGPYDAAIAAERLAGLLRERQVPRDSFVTDGRSFRAQFWPPADGAAAATPPAEAAQPVPQPMPAPQAPETPAAETPAEETPAEARRAEAALSRPDREAVQVALQWFGFYSAAIDGAFGPGSRAAMQAWQSAQGADPTGVLTTRQRAALLADWQAAVAAIGFQRVDEAEAGIALEMPLGLVAFDRYEPPFVHFAPRDGSGWQVLLISQPGDQTTLFGLYDILQTLEIMPLDGPRERRARSFEITGRSAAVETHAFAELSGGLIKGFVLSGPAADAGRVGRVLDTMRGSFRAVGDRALDPGMVPLDAEQKTSLMAGMEIRRPARTGAGAWVDPRGTVLTAAATVAGCARVTIDGGLAAQVVYADPALGIAAVRPEATLAPARHAAVAASLPALRSEVAVAGFAFPEAPDLPTLTFGTFEAAEGLPGDGAARARLTLAALPGDIGGAVLDGGGALVGVLLPQPRTGGRVLADTVQFMVPIGEAAGPLAAAGVPRRPAARAGALAPEDLTEIGRAIAVQVACWN